MSKIQKSPDNQSRTDKARKHERIAYILHALLFAMLFFHVLFSNAQNRASVQGSAKNKQAWTACSTCPLVYYSTIAELEEIKRKYNEANKDVNRFKPVDQWSEKKRRRVAAQVAKDRKREKPTVYATWEEFQKAQAAKGWQLPKTYEETQKARIITTSIPKKL